MRHGDPFRRKGAGMSIEMAEMVVAALAVWLGAGAIVALLFLLLAPRLDHAAKGASIGFRILVFPGLILLWPVIALRALSGRVINRAEAEQP